MKGHYGDQLGQENVFFFKAYILLFWEPYKLIILHIVKEIWEGELQL
jgi:hypothetical protein